VVAPFCHHICGVLGNHDFSCQAGRVRQAIFAPLPDWGAPLGIFAATLFSMALGLLLALALCRDWALGKIQRLIGWMPKWLESRIMNFLHSFVDGLHILPSARKGIWLLAYTLLLWLLYAAMAWILFFSFHFQLGFREALILEIIVGLAVMIPAAPGFIGNYHLACIVALSLFGIAKTPAVSYAILLHILQFFLIVGFGLVFLVISPVPLQFRVKEVVKAARF
jgi:uncharacterized protein (TIRG00374 family)